MAAPTSFEVKTGLMVLLSFLRTPKLWQRLVKFMRTQEKFAEILKFVRTQKLTMLYLASYVLVAVALVRFSEAERSS